MNILGILAAILALGVLIFVHELGHFLMAKATGIAVDEFAIGFGREIIGFTRGETRYKIGWIPFGGYCRMRGEESKDRDKMEAEDKEKAENGAQENDDKKEMTDKSDKTEVKLEEKQPESDQNEEKAPETHDEVVEKDPHAMYNRPAWARVLTVSGGALFNYLLGVIIMILLFMFGFNEEVVPPTVQVYQQDLEGNPTPAYLAGLQDGDTILTMGGNEIESYSDIFKVGALEIDQEISVVYLRDGVTDSTTLTPVKDEETGLGFSGLGPLYTTLIGGIMEGSPADYSDLQEGDRILAINHNEVEYYHELSEQLDSYPTQQVTLTVQREEETFDMDVILAQEDGEGYLGIYAGESISYIEHRKAKNFFNAFAVGFKEANNLLVEVFDGLKALFGGKIDVQKNISGPVRIVQFTAIMATGSRFSEFLRFIALISVALGFFNFMPLPGLDGGHFVINTFEMITTIKPPEKVLRVIEVTGLVFLIGLSILVFLSDIINIILGR